MCIKWEVAQYINGEGLLHYYTKWWHSMDTRDSSSNMLRALPYNFGDNYRGHSQIHCY